MFSGPVILDSLKGSSPRLHSFGASTVEKSLRGGSGGDRSLREYQLRNQAHQRPLNTRLSPDDEGRSSARDRGSSGDFDRYRPRSSDKDRERRDWIDRDRRNDRDTEYRRSWRDRRRKGDRRAQEVRIVIDPHSRYDHHRWRRPRANRRFFCTIYLAKIFVVLFNMPANQVSTYSRRLSPSSSPPVSPNYSSYSSEEEERGYFHTVRFEREQEQFHS